MAYIETINPEDATGRLAECYAELLKTKGRVANIFRLHSMDPESLAAHGIMNLATMTTADGLNRLEREAIVVAVSVANECHYWLHHHTGALRRAGGSDELVDALIEGADPDLESDRLRRIIYFARKSTLLPASMSRQDTEDLRVVGLSDLEILQVVQITAYYNYVNRLANALGVEIED